MSYFDAATLGQAFAGPGMDTRAWISMGTVELETNDVKSVYFNDDNGAPLDTGPLVAVRLHPSDITVACRIARSVAGAGEGEWAPIGAGDEVIVAIPGGVERSGCVILGRLGNSLDAWPQTVAGQDATKNTFAFKRLRSPFILETASSYMVRSATTGAALTIDLDGNVVINNGAAHQLVLRSDIVSLALGDDSVKLQFDPDAKTATFLVGDGATTFLLDGKASQFTSSGSITFATSGAATFGHGVTMEQVLNLLINWTIMLATPTFGSGTLNGDLTATGKLLSNLPNPFPAQFDAAIQTMLPLIVGPNPPTNTSNGGSYIQWPLTFAPITGAIALALSNPYPASIPSAATITPGVGRAGFML